MCGYKYNKDEDNTGEFHCYPYFVQKYKIEVRFIL